MEMYLFHHDTYLKLHNCSIINIDSIPLEKRQHPKTGLAIMILAIILELLYFPCLISLHRRADNACYKIMRYLGIIDVIVLPFNGMFTGWLGMQGWVFCTKPDFLYVVGSLMLGLYCCVSMASVILATNRCLEMIWPSVNERLFAPHLIKYWLIAATFYGLYFIVFTVPIKFCGLYMSWFFSPYAGYTDVYAEMYHNPMHTFNNTVESGSLFTLYTFFIIVILIRSLGNKQIGSVHNSAKRRSQIRTFIQVALISVINVMACAIYVIMNFVPISEFLIILGSFGWVGIHGVPPVIYLTLNRTIRRDTIKMLRLDGLCGGSEKVAPIKTTTVSDVHVNDDHESDHDEPAL